MTRFAVWNQGCPAEGSLQAAAATQRGPEWLWRKRFQGPRTGRYVPLIALAGVQAKMSHLMPACVFIDFCTDPQVLSGQGCNNWKCSVALHSSHCKIFFLASQTHLKSHPADFYRSESRLQPGLQLLWPELWKLWKWIQPRIQWVPWLWLLWLQLW